MAFRTRRLTFALLLAWAGGVAGARVAAQAGPPIQLDAQLPRALERCVTAEQLRDSYERTHQSRIAADARSHQQQPTDLSVQLRSLGSAGGVTRIEVTASTGPRSLGARVLPVRSDDCTALPDTLALVLWLLYQNAEPEPQPALEPPPPLPPQPRAATTPLDTELPPGQRPAQPPPPEPGTPVEFGLGASGAVALGAMPRPALQLQLLVVLRVPILEFRIRAGLLWPQTIAVAEGHITMRNFDVALEACPTWHASETPRLDVRACAGPRLGVLYAESLGFAIQNTSNTELLFHAGAALEASLGVTDTSWLELAAGLGIAVRRPRFVLNFASAQPPSRVAGPEVVRGEIGLNFVQIF
jgi:hypothetical protein